MFVISLKNNDVIIVIIIIFSNIYSLKQTIVTYVCNIVINFDLRPPDLTPFFYERLNIRAISLSLLVKSKKINLK